MKDYLKGLACMLLCMCLLTGICTAEQVINPSFTFDNFIEEVQAENYEQALRMYEELQEEYDYSTTIPEFPVYEIYVRGLLALNNGDLEEALAQIELAQRVGGTNGVDFPDHEGLVPCTIIIAYLKGRIAFDKKEYQTALEYLDECTNYRDTNKLKIRILEIEAEPDRYCLTGTETTDTTAVLSWTDSEAADRYSVVYSCGRKQEQMVQTAECSVTLEELLPETEYSVSVIAEDGSTESLTTRIETKQAEGLHGSIRADGRGYLRFYEANKAEKYTFSQMSNRNMIHDAESMKDSEGTDTGLIGVNVRQGFAKGSYLYDYYIPLSNTDETRTSFSWTMILRMAHGNDKTEDTTGFDVYSVTGTSEAPKARKSIQSLYRFDQVQDLLARHFEAYEKKMGGRRGNH